MPRGGCTVKMFLRDFQMEDDIRYCFILGAGASKQAGIPTGAEFVDRWLKELREDDRDFSLSVIDPAMTEADRYAFYSQVYQYRFAHDPRKGYQFLRDQMRDKYPSFGHAVLAHLMSKSKHNIAVTTNFDALLEDALFMYARERPLLIGHESLAGFMEAGVSVPIVAKIHRDLLFAPLNTKEETDKLGTEWKKALDKVFRACTPLVIGYGGNDGSLMGYLSEISPLPNLYWFYYHKDQPSEPIRRVAERHNGSLIPVAGFDELMFQFALTIGYHVDPQIDEMERVNKERLEAFGERWEKLSLAVAITSSPAVTGGKDVPKVEEIQKVGPIIPDSPLDWLRRIEQEETTEGKDRLFQQAIALHGYNEELLVEHLIFLDDSGQEDKSDALWQKLLEQNPEIYDENLAETCNVLTALFDFRQKYEIALKWQRQMVNILERLEPNTHPSLAYGYCNLSNYSKSLGDDDAALKWQLKAVKTLEHRSCEEERPMLYEEYKTLASRYEALDDIAQTQRCRDKAQAMQSKLENQSPFRC